MTPGGRRGRKGRGKGAEAAEAVGLRRKVEVLAPEMGPLEPQGMVMEGWWGYGANGFESIHLSGVIDQSTPDLWLLFFIVHYACQLQTSVEWSLLSLMNEE